MESVDDLLMFVAIDGLGRPWPGVPGAVLTYDCAQGLVGPHQGVAGAVLDPGAVLDTLDTFIPEGRESQNEHAAIRVLALVAECRGATLRCDGADPTRWTPSDDRDYPADDVQAALAIVAEQLHSSIEYAAHRLFAAVEEAGASLRATSRDVVLGRLCFIGSPTGPTVSIWAHEGSDS